MNENKMIFLWAAFLIIVIGFFAIRPFEYKLETAKGLGDVVRLGDKVYNQGTLDKFVETVNTKKTGNVRLVTYTKEGNAVISRLIYDGYNIKLTIDARRDKSTKGLWKISKSTYVGIEKMDGSKGMEYYLTISGGEKKLIFIGK